MKTIEQLAEAKKGLNESKIRDVLSLLQLGFPNGSEHALELIPVLRYVADVMEVVAAEEGLE